MKQQSIGNPHVILRSEKVDTSKQQKAAARKAVREKEKITQTRLISERGWTKGLIITKN